MNGIKPPIGYSEGSPFNEEVDRVDPQDDPPKNIEKVSEPEEELPEAYLVSSFAELMVRTAHGGDASDNGHKIRIWGKKYEDGYNKSTGDHYKTVVDWPSGYVDGHIYRSRTPYDLEFDVLHPDLKVTYPGNNKRRLAIWGGRITQSNYDAEWAGRVDIGKSYKSTTKEEYEVQFEKLKNEIEERENRRKRR